MRSYGREMTPVDAAGQVSISQLSCAWRIQQSRRRDLLPASERRFELADPPHEIGGRLNTVNGTAELILDVADDCFHRGAIERRGGFMGEIDLRRPFGIVADDARRFVDRFGYEFRR